jgi:putative intracellular protease/amidase
MPARVWIPLPDTDYEPTETAVPWWVLRRAGHEVVFVTEHGARASVDRKLIDGVVLGQLGASPRAKAFHAEMIESPEFQRPVAWTGLDPSGFDGLVLPGGHAPGMRQYLDSPALRDAVAAFWSLDRPVGAICHGVLVLARTKDAATGKSLIAGRRTTCLPGYLEHAAYALTFWKVGRYFRTYRRTVEDEVKSALDDPRTQFDGGPFLFAPAGTRWDDRTALVVQDGNYLSARWPGDAAKFGRRFEQLVAEAQPRSKAPRSQQAEGRSDRLA